MKTVTNYSLFTLIIGLFFAFVQTGLSQTPTPSPSWQAMATDIASISAGSVANIVGTTPVNTFVRWTGGYFSADQQATQMKQVSISASGMIWGVKHDSTIWTKVPMGWVKKVGLLKHVSVGTDTIVWGVNNEDKIFKWNLTTWVPVAGSLKQVSVGADGTVWGVNSLNKIFRWSGGSFTEMPGSATHVSVGSASKVWKVDSAGNVSKWNGSAWDAVPSAGLCKQVAVAQDGTVLVLRNDNALYRMQ